ncbi:hypothetical protein M0R88_16230 [Halorussus gelatinilyticus]|uniref:Uncharacterized protein n=1 Tax=Halorussus gelatinilyticus TaxID=2937524 RepID=A0A8U0IGP0_9EURY|nr:hypothetical protein [Halorussus gelatinilyticus]UPW00048.1 hypothetical protein M0R88_16230 [Halorussus gelatinilyticus]
MTTHHLASWLVKHSDIPLTVVKPVATKLGVSTNYLGAALFAGQIVYENQGAIVKYADRGGVKVGEFLHRRAVERYGEDHALTRHLGENVAALDEAFEGSEEEAVTFAEFYRQLRTIDRDTPSLAPAARLPNTDLPDANLPEDALPDVDLSDKRLPDVDLSGVVGGATGAVADQRDRLADLRTEFGSDGETDSDSESESESVEIPVVDEK